MIMYQLLRMSYLKEDTAFDTSIWLLLPAILIACGAAWRLAKFNIDERQSISFRGVPTPITGFMVAALPLVVWYNSWDLAPLVLNRWVLYVITVLISYLMVSDLPIMSLKFKDYSFKGNQPKIILAVISIILAVVFQWAAIPLIYLTYVALSLLLRKQIS
jgi:CDP-diacylglycerol--serine O-phosphatidyltransferase